MTSQLLVAISDTHNQAHRLTIPPCKWLVHAGDYSLQGYEYELFRFLDWLAVQPAEYKVFINGNHELDVQYKTHLVEEAALCRGITFLQDSGLTLGGLSFYGSPWQPWFYDWAFNFPRDHFAYRDQARATWGKIPEDTDVVITHGPPYKLNDLVNRPRKGEDPHVGCRYLLERLLVVNPVLHIAGHIHSEYGESTLNGQRTLFVNAASMDERYNVVNPPRVYDMSELVPRLTAATDMIHTIPNKENLDA